MKKLIMICAIAVVWLFAAPINADLTGRPGVGSYRQGGILSHSPDYNWWYGCSPTSAGMMMGYYDINGYGGLYYKNLVAGGTAELSTFGAGPYIANDAIASSGHIADFYAGGYLASGDDVAPPFHSFNSLADFMGTSQDSIGNTGNPNGATLFHYFMDGTPLHDYDALAGGYWNDDGMYGMGEYVAYAGYGTANLYTQLTNNDFFGYGFSGGFSFSDYQSEIDAGRVVMLHVYGHTMFGYGYGDNNTVYLNDTWSLGPHTMTWGGAYSGLDMWGVTAMELTGGVIPAPAAVVLGGIGVGLVSWLRRRRTL